MARCSLRLLISRLFSIRIFINTYFNIAYAYSLVAETNLVDIDLITVCLECEIG